MDRILTIIAIALVSGCAIVDKNGASTHADSTNCYMPNSENIAPCLPRTRIENLSSESIKDQFKNEPWTKKKESPEIGLSLMGGGSQAASFGLGVIKRLVDEGVIHHVDLLSTVSGGGYAALYLYTRAKYLQEYQRKSDADPLIKLKALFENLDLYRFNQDIDKKKALGVRSPDLARFDRDGCQTITESTSWICKNSTQNSTKEEKEKITKERITADYRNNWDNDLSRFNCSQLSIPTSLKFTQCYPDILSNSQGYESRTYDNWWQWTKPLLAELPISLLFAPVHLLVNVAFDTQINVSPSKLSYRRGIWRAFGHVPSCVTSGHNKKLNQSKDCVAENMQDRHLWEFSAESEDFSFDKLKGVIETAEQNQEPLPMWILNAGSPSRASFDFSTIDLKRMDDFRFEFTPYSFGSHRYNFVNESPDSIGVDTMTALVASAAFLDPSQRIFPWYWNMLASAGMNLLNFDWTVSIPNYTFSPTAQRILRLTPPPLQYLSRQDEPNLRPRIPLGDGGVTRDNFGLISLLERGTRHIFMIDHVDDVNDKISKTVGMENLCKVAEFLDSKGLIMEFYGHPNDPKDSEDKIVYNILDHCNDKYQFTENKPDVRTSKFKLPLNYLYWTRALWQGKIKGKLAQENKKHLLDGVRLYLVKTAINKEKFKEGTDSIKGFDDNLNFDENPVNVPTILKAWMYEGGTGSFPQDSMAVLTYNSSPSLFGAYLELGNFLAKDIVGCINDIRKGTNEVCNNID